VKYDEHKAETTQICW